VLVYKVNYFVMFTMKTVIYKSRLLGFPGFSSLVFELYISSP
jgi:hypothetical protein